MICKSHLPPEGIQNKCFKISLQSAHFLTSNYRPQTKRNAGAFPIQHAGTQHVSLPFPFAPHPVQPSSMAPTSQPGAHTGMRQTQTQEHTGTKRKEAKHEKHAQTKDKRASLSKVWYLDSVRWREMQIKTMPSYLQWNKNNVLGWAGLWLTL